MKGKFLTGILCALACCADAAEFADLAVKAYELKPARQLAGAPAPAALGVGLPAAGSNKWYGSDSRRFRMRFESYVLYEIPEDYAGPVSRILSDRGQVEKISGILAFQLQHMYGAFSMHPAFVSNPGIPSGDYKVKFLEVQKVPGGRYAKVSYSYDDIVVFSKKMLGAGAVRIEFVLPKDPAAIYWLGFPTAASRKNRCTDEHYNGLGDFWYFWNPFQEGCPITRDDLVTVRAVLEPMPMTRETYPDYDRLYGENGNGDVLQVVYLVGVDENFRNGDLGKKTFKDAFAGLQEAGFRATVDEPRRKRLTYRFGEKRASIEMRLADPNSAEFAAAAVRGLETADIFLYDGHSGLGGYLNPDRLAYDAGRPLELPSGKYQIFVFQGCSTYAYYNSAYFKLKRSVSDPKGSKNLDIITTGIGADFAVGAKTDVAFLASVTMGDRPSWQTIIDRIHAAEGESSALTHVNGDEDNPRAP